MKQIRKSGITIVTLVITVIVLAVLTGAVMLTMVGDNGIFGETQSTIDKYNKQAMLEQIQLKIQKKRLAKVNEGQYSLKLEEDILPILETFGTYNESEMKLTTTEKNIDIYLYEIVNIPIKEIANVTYANEELTITEKVSLPNGYTFEYTKDNGIIWSEYTSTTTIAEENGILIRLKNEEGKVVSSEYKVTSGVIEEIDSTKPIISIDTNGVTTGKTIKVTIIVTDEKGLDRNNTYEYCISTTNNDTTGATWIPYTNGISFTVGEGLTGGYYIHVKGVTDTSGNESGNKVSEMLTFDNTVPAVTIDIGRITETSIEVLAQSTDNSGQVKSTEYSIDNGQTWKTNNIFTNLTENTSYTVKVKSVDIFNNENIQEKAVTTNPRTWNGKIDISWYTKDPNKTTFDISTPNELAGLALLVDNEIAYYDDPHDANSTSGTYSIGGSEFEGKTIVLNNDILINENVLNEDGTLNEANASTFVQWEPIGQLIYNYDTGELTESGVFKGVFNGNKKSISGIYVYSPEEYGVGLFSYLKNGTIIDLTVQNSYVYGERRVGAITGVLNIGVLENCASVDNYMDANSFATGGLVGELLDGTITKCYNTSYVEGNMESGGIVGQMRGGSIYQSYNNGIVQNRVSTNGGIVGVLRKGNISECYNTAIIAARDLSGGIFGEIASYKDWHGDVEITMCYNTGEVLGDGNGRGGIGGGFNVFESCTISGCYNEGVIFANGDRIGGVVGMMQASTCQFTQCHNEADINVSGTAVGGIVGSVNRWICMQFY